LDTTGSIKEPPSPRNKIMDEFRDENEGPAPQNPLEIRRKVKVASLDDVLKNLFGPTEEQSAAHQKFSDEIWFAQTLNEQRKQEYSKTPQGQIMDALGTGLMALGPGKGVSPRAKPPVVGGGISEPNVNPTAANQNVPGEEWRFNPRVPLPEGWVGKAPHDEFMKVMETRTDTFGKSLDKSVIEINKMIDEWIQGNPQNAYNQALKRQKEGKQIPPGASAEDFVNSVKEAEKTQPNLVIDNTKKDEPPIQGMSRRRMLDIEGKPDTPGTGYSVNVGRGRGALNDNIDVVNRMITEGRPVNEIAERFDVTPMAVRNWINRRGIDLPGKGK
jgi:hypothetical protein